MESVQPDVEVKLKANRGYFVQNRPWVDSWTIAIILENVAAKSQIQAERLDLGLWVRHLFRDKEPTPSAGQALFDARARRTAGGAPALPTPNCIVRPKTGSRVRFVFLFAALA